MSFDVLKSSIQCDGSRVPSQWLAVYCAARDGHSKNFQTQSQQLGEWLALKNIGLVYGGGSVGLMGVLARSVLSHHGQVYGVIPQSMVEKELALRACTELKVVSSMHERKALMAERANAFVALPGGFGTFDELFEIITWAQLGYHTKPIALMNWDGYYDPLIHMIDHATQNGFIPLQQRDLYQVLRDNQELSPWLQTAGVSV